MERKWEFALGMKFTIHEGGEKKDIFHSNKKLAGAMFVYIVSENTSSSFLKVLPVF